MTKVYVTMTDKFMSGWGGAEGRTAKYVIVCDNYAEAAIVADNAHHRSEMKYVNIVVGRKPSFNAKRFQVSYATKKEAGNWFIPGYFRK
jgi:hypothetical protein